MFIQLSSHRQSTTRRTDTSLKRRIKTHWETRKVEQVLQFDSWIKNGKLHRVGDAPAFIRYYKNGNIQNEAWIKNGKYHRIDAPANIEYFVTGEILAEEWFKNDKHHRPGGAPAFISYFQNGQICEVEWYENGKERCVS